MRILMVHFAVDHVLNGDEDEIETHQYIGHCQTADEVDGHFAVLLLFEQSATEKHQRVTNQRENGDDP